MLGVLRERIDAFQWHYYTFELPAGAELLADEHAARQAYRLGERTWGVQFHPEVTRHMLDSWFVEGVGGAAGPPPASAARPTRGSARGTSRAARLCGAFLDRARQPRRRLSSTGSAGSADHSCHEPT